MSGPVAVRWQARPGLEAQFRAVAATLERWDGTPYQPNKQDRGPGGGVDCVRFVAGVLDDLRGKRTPIETLPPDAAMHDRPRAIAAMLKLRRALEPNDEIKPVAGVLLVEPGDVVVTGPVDGAGGHALLVGTQPNVLWESNNVGVRRVGMSALKRAGIAVFHAFRPTDKAAWGRE